MLTIPMASLEIENKLYEFIRTEYPGIKINVEETIDHIRQLYFVEDRFEALYPKQRYHGLMHLIPPDFYDQNLQDAEWYELAPNEKPEDLDYHDQETLDEIKEPILSILKDKVFFISLLDKKFMKEKAKCCGDFTHSKEILTQLNFSTENNLIFFMC